MCSEQLPKEFEKTTEVLPFSKYGLSSMEEFQQAESEIQRLEKFKRAGLSDLEIKLFLQNEAGTIDQKKMESSVLKHKLDVIYDKIRKLEEKNDPIEDKATTSDDILKPLEKPITYPEGHPMNSIKDIESNLFSHLKTDDIPSLSKRRKMLRRFERKKERILSQDHSKPYPDTEARPSSKWDMRELPNNKEISGKTGLKWDIQEPTYIPSENKRHKSPTPRSKWDMQDIPSDRVKNTSKIQNMTERETQPRPVPYNRLPIYTIKDNKIVRVEPQERVEDRLVEARLDDGEELLEGTKITVDDIKKIDQHKDYEPGIPSKVLVLKNISSSVREEQLKLLFNQFILGNGGPVQVEMLEDRGNITAYVYFTNEDTAIQALEEANGTVVAGRPIVAYFNRHR